MLDTSAAETAKSAYFALAQHSLFSLPLYPARNSLRARFTAEADRVIADYREASESTPVTTRDWRRAQAALNSALALSPGDKSLTGKRNLIDGHLKLKAGDVKDAPGRISKLRAGCCRIRPIRIWASHLST